MVKRLDRRDSFGRLIGTTEIDVFGNETHYDPFGRKEGLTRADGANRLIHSDPLGRTIGYSDFSDSSRKLTHRDTQLRTRGYSAEETGYTTLSNSHYQNIGFSESIPGHRRGTPFLSEETPDYYSYTSSEPSEEVHFGYGEEARLQTDHGTTTSDNLVYIAYCERNTWGSYKLQSLATSIALPEPSHSFDLEIDHSPIVSELSTRWFSDIEELKNLLTIAIGHVHPNVSVALNVEILNTKDISSINFDFMRGQNG